MQGRIAINLGGAGPFPDAPEPPSTPASPAMVYVSETPRWQYKVVARAVADEQPSEAMLDALGERGWELTGVAALAAEVRYFFKRARGD